MHVCCPLQSATTAIQLFKQHFPESASDVEGLEEVVRWVCCAALRFVILFFALAAALRAECVEAHKNDLAML